MTSVTVAGDLLAHLQGFREQVELRDENGRLVGHFIPAKKGPVELLPSDRCPYSPEDLERMRNETGGRPLAEIWNRLGAKWPVG